MEGFLLFYFVARMLINNVEHNYNLFITMYQTLLDFFFGLFFLSLFWSLLPQRFLTLLFSSLQKQEVTARVFMPLFECPSKRCVMNKSKGNVILQLRASKFLRFQEVCTLPWTLLHWSISDTCFITLFSAQLLIYFFGQVA
jgi:hypothetical protein